MFLRIPIGPVHPTKAGPDTWICSFKKLDHAGVDLVQSGSSRAVASGSGLTGEAKEKVSSEVIFTETSMLKLLCTYLFGHVFLWPWKKTNFIVFTLKKHTESGQNGVRSDLTNGFDTLWGRFISSALVSFHLICIQSLRQVNDKCNPFIKTYRWVHTATSAPCDLCLNHYEPSWFDFDLHETVCCNV